MGSERRAGIAARFARALTAAAAIAVLPLGNAALAASAERPPLVFAASSLQESLSAAARAFARRGHGEPTLSFGASSALARQIAAGAPADLFLSADEEWMDELASRGLIRRASRADLVAGRLVLIAPRASRTVLRIRDHFALRAALDGGRLALANPDAVPAGRYARAALTALHVWPTVADRLGPADNVRGALTFVERGAAPLGIVYETDALASRRVRIVGIFPNASHPPIVYPIAVLARSSQPQAEAFRRFLLSPAGQAIFRRFGFVAR